MIFMYLCIWDAMCYYFNSYYFSNLTNQPRVLRISSIYSGVLSVNLPVVIGIIANSRLSLLAVYSIVSFKHDKAKTSASFKLNFSSYFSTRVGWIPSWPQPIQVA